MSEQLSSSAYLLISVLSIFYCLIPMFYARWLEHWGNNLPLNVFGCVVGLGLVALVLSVEFFLGRTNLAPRPMDDPFFSIIIIAENVLALAIFFWKTKPHRPCARVC